MEIDWRTPLDFRCSFGPIPESINIWGELTDPADTITSLLAMITCFLLFFTNDTPMAFLFFMRI
jgi:hypothetical protein